MDQDIDNKIRGVLEACNEIAEHTPKSIAYHDAVKAIRKLMGMESDWDDLADSTILKRFLIKKKFKV